MPVQYNSKKLIPAPQVRVTKQYNRRGDGTIVGATYSLVVTGTIVAYKGSPNSTGVFHTTSGYPADEAVAIDSRLTAILRKQEAIRDLFSDDGMSFEVQGLDGAQPLKCNPRVISVEFPEGLWVDKCEYVITLEADKVYPMEEDTFSDMIVDSQESWNLDTDESPEGEGLPRTYRLVHNVSAVGKRFYDTTGILNLQPWEQARNYVLGRLGMADLFNLSSGVMNLPSYYGGYNHLRSEQKDESTGSFSVTESWLVTSGTALEDFTVETSKELNSIVRVSINGNIIGLEQRNSNLQLVTSKYANALTRFAISSGLALSRAQSYAGITLNIIPLSERISRNPITGTLGYGYDYDNRPSNLVSGAKSEVINLSDNYNTQVVGIVPVIGRTRGPVLQDIGTSEPLNRQLSIEAIMDIPSFNNVTVSDIRTAFITNKPYSSVQNIVEAVNPANNGYSQCYKQNERDTWDAKTGRYTYEISWIYEL